MKGKCKCGHAKSIHVGDFDYDVCCATWLSRKDGFVNMCDCRGFALSRKGVSEK